jgi:hypothetical protein
MANNTRNREVGILGAAAALAIAALMIAYPVVATSTPLTGTTDRVSVIGPPTSLPPPPPVGEQIILTSTSGLFYNLSSNNAVTIVGPAAGTMTLTVTANPTTTLTVAANPIMVYTLSVTAGSVSLGTTTIAFTGGSAFMNPYQTLIFGSGTVAGGTFVFHAFSLAPSIRQIHPLDFNTLLIHLHVGGHYYFVLLHVKTIVIAPLA